MIGPLLVRARRVAALALLLRVPAASALRPFNGTDAGTLDPGTIELELGPVDWVGDDGSDGWVPSASVNAGLARGWEASLSAAPTWDLSGEADDSFTWGEIRVTGKRRLREGSLQEKAGPSAAIEASLQIPVSPGAEGVGALLTPVVSYTWHGCTAHLSGNAAWTTAHEPAVSGSLILESPDFSPGARAGFEVATGWERHAGRAWSVLPALLWSVHDQLTFDAGYLYGRVFGATQHEIRAGVTWSFGAWGAARASQP